MFRMEIIIKKLLLGVGLVAVLCLPACDDASQDTQPKSLKEKMLEKQKQELENTFKSPRVDTAKIISVSLIENGQESDVSRSEEEFFLELVKTVCIETKSFDSKEVQKQMVGMGYGNIVLKVEASFSSNNVTEMTLAMKSPGPMNVMCQSSSGVRLFKHD
jgi:hypothetical protein